jgi:hypothetical protein
MDASERDAATVYAAWFAARSDDFVTWTGDTWMRASAPLTGEVVLAAIHGGASVSSYFITPENTTHVAAIDFDLPDGIDLARRVRAAMARQGVAGHVEVSREGRSHLWLVLDHPIAAKVMRRALRAYLRDAGIEESPKIELRPAQDEIKPDGFGAPLRMPTMPNPKTGLRYPMLAADDSFLPRDLAGMLLRIDDAAAWRIESAAASLRPTLKDLARGDRRPYYGPAVEGSASDILRRLWGAVDARPGHAIRCPAHDDKHPSLSILADDQRACCKSPTCDLYNDGRGRGIYELTKMAPSHVGGSA